MLVMQLIHTKLKQKHVKAKIAHVAAKNKCVVAIIALLATPGTSDKGPGMCLKVISSELV